MLGSALADLAAEPDVILPPAAVLVEAGEEEVVVPFQAHVATPSATPSVVGPQRADASAPVLTGQGVGSTGILASALAEPVDKYAFNSAEFFGP